MFLNKWGTARHIYIPVPKAGSANHAVGADWTPAAGDVKISKDGGAAANVTNLPTAIAMGNSALWDFSLTATEMEAAQVVITVADSATKAVDDTGFEIETYGNASAQHAFDLDTASTAQTGDNFARLGAPAGASVSADILSLDGRLPATLVSGRMDSSVGAMAANVLTATAIAANAITAAKFASGAIDAAALATDAVDEIWAKAVSDLAGVPASNAQVISAISFLFMALRNLRTQTSTQNTISNDAGATIGTAATSDDGTTNTKGEYA